MTDNDIIKALECCVGGECADCCFDEQTACKENLLYGAIAFINRQKADIELKTMDVESLTNERNALKEMVEEQVAEIKELNAMHKASQRINVDLLRQIKEVKIETSIEFAKRMKEKLWLGSDLLMVDSVLEGMVGDVE